MNQKKNALWELLILYCIAIIGAATLAPSVYGYVRCLAFSHPSKCLTYLARHPLEAYFERIRQLTMLLPIPWLLRRWSLNSWSALGMAWNQKAAKEWLLGMGIGLAIMISLIIALNSLGGVKLRYPSFKIISQIIGVTLLSGMFLGFLEELVFRGIIFSLFRNSFSSIWAVILCSLFFAYTHFKAESNATITSLGLADGFHIAYETIINIFYHFDAVYFLILFLLSTLLCLVTLCTNGLAQAIGLHWGIVWGLLASRKLLAIEKPLQGSFWWGQGAFQTSPIVLLMLIILNAIYLRLFLQKRYHGRSIWLWVGDK